MARLSLHQSTLQPFSVLLSYHGKSNEVCDNDQQNPCTLMGLVHELLSQKGYEINSAVGGADKLT